MNKFFHQLIAFVHVQKWEAFLLNTLLVASMVFANYYFKLSHWMLTKSVGIQLAFFATIFTLIYGGSILIHKKFYKTAIKKEFRTFFALAIALFTLKSIPYHKEWTVFFPSFIPQIWEKTLYHWLLKDFLILSLTIYAFKKYKAAGFIPGLSFKNIPWNIVLVCWLVMIPLLVWAGFQPGFLAQYPKMNFLIEAGASKLELVFFELLYSFDFLLIEVFFRGLLVIGAARFLGEHAILTMASFYCAIHFGKPLPECISSYFGGTILGVLALRSGKITSGFLIHVSVALGMEITSFLGKK